MPKRYISVGILIIVIIIFAFLWNLQRNFNMPGYNRPTVVKGRVLNTGRQHQTEVNKILYSDASHVMLYQRPDYLPGYRNPCFIVTEDKNGYHPLADSEERQPAMFKFTACFPSMFLVGFRKCGTTDISKVLHHHKGVQRGNKEYRFFGTSSNSEKPTPLNKSSYTVLDYVTLLKSSAPQINESKYHGVEMSILDDSISPDYGKTLLLGDYTPGYTDVFLNWKSNPMNKGLDLPKYVIPHLIYHLVPQAKILFMLRNPVERIWSSFRYKLRLPKICHLFSCHNITSLAIHFHHGMKRAISQWRLCELFYRGDSRMCLYHYSDKTFLYNKSGKMQFEQTDNLFIRILAISLYYVPLMEYYSVFPKENILIIDLEKYTENRWQFMNDVVLPFLDLPPFTESNSVNLRISNKSKIKLMMLQETRDMLDQFYAPYQRKLATLRELNN